MTARSPQPITLRSVAPSVYLPSLLYGIGQGAIAPVIALSALELGASAGVASLVVAAVGVGHLVADVPAGALTMRIGERRPCCSRPCSSVPPWLPACSPRPCGCSRSPSD